MNENDRSYYLAGEYSLPIGPKTYIMGIINVTPDSFSDGGLFFSEEKAAEHAERLVSDKADMLDIGGESTRPGHIPVSDEEELNRVIPAIRRIVTSVNVPVSVDTSKASVASRAVEEGVSIVNDIWGLRRDPDIARVVSEAGVGLILMFNATDPELTKNSGDIVSDAISFLKRSIDIALSAGVGDNQIMLDPGIGFGMSHAQSFELIRGIGRIKELGFPLLVGPSRKRFIGAALGGIPVERRDRGTAAVSCIAAYLGADAIRVHNVSEVAESLIIADILSGKRKYEED